MREAAKDILFVGSRSRVSLAIGAVLVASSCSNSEVSGRLDQRAYVWQRSWTSEVAEAVRGSSGFTRLLVLAAEVDPNEPESTEFFLRDFSSLRSSPGEVGACLRIRELHGRFADRPGARDLVLRTLRAIVAEAERASISLREIQIDYDCAESRLEDFALLLREARGLSPLPLTITALPAWLNREREFSRIAREVDSFTLQLHGLERRDGEGSSWRLMNVEKADEWVLRAAGLGKPFFVALPTYAHLVRAHPRERGPEHKERVRASGSLATGVSLVGSDAERIARFVSGWSQRRPPELRGICWFRLPVRGDRLNWAPETLKAVQAGRTPRAELLAFARGVEPGLFDLVVRNGGEGTTGPPPKVEIHGSQVLAADAVGGFVLRRAPGNELSFELTAPAPLLWPGDEMILGWVRVRGDAPPELRLPTFSGSASSARDAS